ncbi:MAG: ribosome biogenesis GTPase Der [Candidatus Saccharimonadales bacterium]
MSKNLPIVTIVGRPNVGKSSLFNRLLGERKAVVSDTAGTTRDRVQAIVEWGGRDFWLIDTAGLEAAENELEASMQAQLEVARSQADVILIVIDASTILSDSDNRIIKDAYKSGKPIIVAANKSDRKHPQVEFDKLPAKQVVPVSAIHGTGSGDLLDAIIAHVPKVRVDAELPPAIAIVGRPNVGKSSLLNVLAGEDRAIVANEGGTTRDVNDIDIVHEGLPWRLLDTAGIRKIGKRAHDIEQYSTLRTLRAINDSDVCVLVTDANEPATGQDQRIAGMIKEAGKGMLIAINKWDLTERSDADVRRLELEYQRRFQFVWWAPLVMTSATTRHNVFKIIELASTIQANRQRKLTTSELNTYLRDAMSAHPPAGLKNRHPKLKYITQTEVAPPTFTVFGTHTPFLHWSYKRFLEAQLRDRYDFTGTPVRFQWRSSKKEEAV